MQDDNPYAATEASISPTPDSAQAESVLSALAIEELAKTQPWAHFLAICGLIGSVLMMLFAGYLIANAGTGVGSGKMTGVGFLYGFFSLIFIYPAMKLKLFSSRIKSFTRTRSMEDLENAFLQQRLAWRFYGVVSAVYLIYMVGALVFMLKS